MLLDNPHSAPEYEVAAMHAHGYGVPKNETEARKWLERAAEQGHAAEVLEAVKAL